MLKLITWNIQSARAPHGGADLDRVIAALARFSDFDVLCLQEVACGFPARDGSDGGNQFTGLVARLPGYHAASGLALDVQRAGGGRRRLGCMTFSRYPVRQVWRHSLPWPADPAVPSMPRIALETTLDTPAGLLRVLNTHLEYFSEAQRLAQADQLRALQAEACAHARAPRPGLDENGPFAALPRPPDAVLAGDFNMLPGSPAWQRLLAPFEDATPPWRDAWQLAQPGVPHPPTVGLHDAGPDAAPPFTFDYLFVSAGLAPRVRRVRVDGAAGGSDHQAVLLELG
jgi:endonuclease/exonuclease/phosphatase family metal-dependent hydrolase